MRACPSRPRGAARRPADEHSVLLQRHDPKDRRRRLRRPCRILGARLGRRARSRRSQSARHAGRSLRRRRPYPPLSFSDEDLQPTCDPRDQAQAEPRVIHARMTQHPGALPPSSGICPPELIRASSPGVTDAAHERDELAARARARALVQQPPVQLVVAQRLARVALREVDADDAGARSRAAARPRSRPSPPRPPRRSGRARSAGRERLERVQPQLPMRSRSMSSQSSYQSGSISPAERRPASGFLALAPVDEPPRLDGRLAQVDVHGGLEREPRVDARRSAATAAPRATSPSAGWRTRAPPSCRARACPRRTPAASAGRETPRNASSRWAVGGQRNRLAVETSSNPSRRDLRRGHAGGGSSGDHHPPKGRGSKICNRRR